MKKETIYTMPFHALKNPFSAFETMRYRKLTSLKMSVILFFVFALQSVIQLQMMGKQFQIVQQSAINLPLSVFSAFIILFIWTLANWCFCVLIEGKATFKNIWIISVYSLMPYTIAGYINIVLGLVLTQEEGVFRTIITALGALWSLVMIIAAFMNFHEFEFGKAVLSIILTVIGMVIIAVLIFIVYSLFQQLFSNVLVLVNEIIFRIKLAG
ncbi:MAG: YIP1 family protein [Clostridia bacterium]|nr:YIP1 family protein [Clostridia bacterium]